MVKTAAVGLLTLSLAACNPSDTRPGLRLSGESSPPPEDWSFTDDHPEIAVEVATPYFIPHSVTIWCAQVDGTLYIGARAPQEKNWPGWVDKDPNVRLLVGESIFEATLIDVSDAAEIARLQQAYMDKYDIESMEVPGVGIRYWRVSSG